MTHDLELSVSKATKREPTSPETAAEVVKMLARLRIDFQKQLLDRGIDEPITITSIKPTNRNPTGYYLTNSQFRYKLRMAICFEEVINSFRLIEDAYEYVLQIAARCYAYAILEAIEVTDEDAEKECDSSLILMLPDWNSIFHGDKMAFCEDFSAYWCTGHSESGEDLFWQTFLCDYVAESNRVFHS